MPTEDEYARAIVDTVRAPLLVLDDELTVVSANPAFLLEYDLHHEDVVGRSLWEVDDGHWQVPELVSTLEGSLPEGEEVRDLALRIPLGERGRRDIRLNAHPVGAGEAGGGRSSSSPSSTSPRPRPPAGARTATPASWSGATGTSRTSPTRPPTTSRSRCARSARTSTT